MHRLRHGHVHDCGGLQRSSQRGVREGRRDGEREEKREEWREGMVERRREGGRMDGHRKRFLGEKAFWRRWRLRGRKRRGRANRWVMRMRKIEKE